MSAAEAAPEAPVQQEPQQSVTNNFVERACLKGHNQAVTSLQVNADCTQLASGSRDRTALIWSLPKQQGQWAVEQTRLVGHNHFVSDVCFSSDSTHLLTSSWDKTIRLWDLEKRTSKKVFLDHRKDVLAVTFSPSSRRIISCSRDKTVKVWNTVGRCKFTLTCDEWATSVSCYTDDDEKYATIAVGFWDGKVKVWNIRETCDAMFTLDAHPSGRCTSVAFTPDGQWLITGGSDRKLCMWNVANGTKMMSFTASAPISAVACCPTRAWACAATYEGIFVWDIQEKRQIDLVQPNFPQTAKARGRTPDCTSIAWQEDGRILYSGYNNGEIYVWEVRSE